MLTRAIDICGATLALLVTAPLLALVALAIKLDSDGPVLYTQLRVGKGGRTFRLYKLRSMAVGADAGAAITGKGDPRITRVGQVIRALRIDEVPQFLNVLKGDMSLVGPRPEVPSIVDGYSPEQREILSVRPGLTGPTQLAWLDEAAHFPPGVDQQQHYVDHILPEKLRGDLWYVRTRSLGSDLSYLIWTPLRIVQMTLGNLGSCGRIAGSPGTHRTTSASRRRGDGGGGPGSPGR